MQEPFLKDLRREAKGKKAKMSFRIHEEGGILHFWDSSHHHRAKRLESGEVICFGLFPETIRKGSLENWPERSTACALLLNLKKFL
jgi:hypothetical protein